MRNKRKMQFNVLSIFALMNKIEENIALSVFVLIVTREVVSLTRGGEGVEEIKRS